LPTDILLYGNYKTWEEISHYIRFVRANGKCERCGAIHGEPHPKNGKPTRLYCCHLDHTKSNHSEENLLSMCDLCHLEHDKKQHASGRSFSRRYGKRAKEVLYGLFDNEIEIIGKRRKRIKRNG
jgi:hypothetical protein